MRRINRGLFTLFAALSMVIAPGSALAQQGDPIYNIRYYSDASYTVEVGFDRGECYYWGAGYASHHGESTPYTQYELVGYCYQGMWYPV